MSGRGNFNTVKQKIVAAGGKALEATNESVELHLLAEQYGVQARRLKHTIDRLAKIHDRRTTTVHKETLTAQNRNTLGTILLKPIKVGDAEEQNITNMLHQANPAAGAIEATYTRAMIWYQQMQSTTKTLAVTAMREHTQKRLQHKTKGMKAMSSALNPTPPKPLLRAKRDRDGPNGEQVGSITTDPAEVDAIATRAWQAIYNGNVKDLYFEAKSFIKKYDKYVFKGPTFQLKPIIGKE